jgi:hypothetical protein
MVAAAALATTRAGATVGGGAARAEAEQGQDWQQQQQARTRLGAAGDGAAATAQPLAAGGAAPEAAGVPQLVPKSRLPSKETVLFVVRGGAKAAFVQTFFLVLIGATSGLLGAGAGEAWGARLRTLLFLALQLAQISALIPALLAALVQSHARRERAVSRVPAGDRWELWFNAALFAALVSPLLWFYLPSQGAMRDVALCAAVQWALKLLCMVSFPREVVTVPTD